MLKHYWKSFTNRPPSRLPAFGMAQSSSDLARHVAAAKRAVLRDCGGKADCQWLHSLERQASGPQAAISRGFRSKVRGRDSTRQRRARAADTESTAAAQDETAVKNVLAEEVAMNRKAGGANKKMESEETALLWEVKALLAQKQLVKQQVDRLMKQAASSTHPTAEHAHSVFKDLRSVLGGTFDSAASASSALARADRAAKIGKATAGVAKAAAAAHAKSPHPATSATDILDPEQRRKAEARKEETAKKAAENKEAAVEKAAEEEAQQRQQHKLARQRAKKEQARAREQARLDKDERERAREQEAGWVHVRKFVAPWDPCAEDAGVAADEAVQEPTSMCKDLSLIREAVQPEHGLGLLSLIQSRPLTPEWTSDSIAEGSVDEQVRATTGAERGEGRQESGLMGAMTRFNLKQQALNRRRLKLYIKVFGAAYKGEGSRRQSRAQGLPVDQYDTFTPRAAAAAAGPQSLSNGLLELVGLAPPTAPAAAGGDTKLQQLLHHISRSRPDWAQVTHDWDVVGEGVPALLRLSAHARTVLKHLSSRQSLAGSRVVSAQGGRVAVAVAEAGGRRVAVASALEVEEAQLLKAEESILLQRRQAAARALSSSRTAATREGRVY